MRIRPTELGWKGLSLLAALECAFLATAYGNLFFLLLVFCCALGACGMLWAIGNLRRVEVAMAALPMAPAAVERPAMIELRVRGRARHGVDMALLVGEEVIPLPTAEVVAGPTPIHATLPPRPRGVAPVRGIRLGSSFPFGLFRVTRTIPLDGEVVTWPAPLDTVDGRYAARDGLDEACVGARSSSLAGLRPFRQGDSPADVHWKATARRGKVIVKEREHEAATSTVFVLDRRCSASDFEPALSAIAAAVDRRERHATNECIEVLAQDARVRLDERPGAAAAMRRWLAQVTPLPAKAPAPPSLPGAIRLPAADRPGAPS